MADGQITEERIEERDEIEISEENFQEFVTFVIGEEIFGVDVLKVHEIIGMTDITPVPNSIIHMKGVINMRGNVVPVVDLRQKFNMEEIEYTQITVIIIVEVTGRFVGMIVDTVSDVVDLPESKIHDSRDFNTQIASEFIQGIGQANEDLIILLNVEKILDIDEIEKGGGQLLP